MKYYKRPRLSVPYLSSSFFNIILAAIQMTVTTKYTIIALQNVASPTPPKHIIISSIELNISSLILTSLLFLLPCRFLLHLSRHSISRIVLATIRDTSQRTQIQHLHTFRIYSMCQRNDFSCFPT